MEVSVEVFSNLIQAQFVGTAQQLIFNHTSIDSRSLQNNKQTLFWALKGAHHDAHQYIESLAQRGVQFFVVSELPKERPASAQFFVVANVMRALQLYAAAYRSQYRIPVIGITGSRGKTVVKEWLNFLLSPDYHIIKSPKSYNSQVGVPLSVLGINDKHNLGIFEAGISTVSEMEFLQPVIQPSLGILTAIGADHQEGFDCESQKIDEKLKLFAGGIPVIMEYKPEIMQRLAASNEVFSWSFTHKEAAVFLTRLQTRGLQVECGDLKFELKLPFDDDNSVWNMATCICCMLFLKCEVQAIQQRMTKLYRIETRLEVKNGINQCTVIDDSFNADFQSLKIALDFLEHHKAQGPKTIVLSDVFQSGFSEDVLYGQVRDLLLSNKMDRIIGVGKAIVENLSDMPGFTGYLTTEAWLQKFNASDFQSETILIKGARSFNFQRIVSLLEEKTHETVLEIDLNAIRHNLNFYRSKLEAKTKVMVMVKAFGYGNGSFEIAKLLAYDKVDYLGVAFADEGIALRKAGIQLPIIVMNPEASAFSAMIAYDLEPEVYSIKVLKAFLNLAQERNCYQYPIHLKIDTGMHRLGFLPGDFQSLIELLRQTNILEVQSIFSHLSSSDVPDYEAFTLQQIADFRQAAAHISQALDINPIRHILNTSGIYHYPEHQMEMVRLGIGLYGIGNDKSETSQLQNVSTLKTIVLQIRTICAGESVGYARKFRSVKTTRIATIPIGYADGIHRSWGNEKGYVYIKEQKASIIGSICMDMLMVDVSDIDCEEGEAVEVFGALLPVTAIAQQINTIPYEILTSISQRVKRVFFQA